MNIKLTTSFHNCFLYPIIFSIQTILQTMKRTPSERNLDPHICNDSNVMSTHAIPPTPPTTIAKTLKNDSFVHLLKERVNAANESTEEEKEYLRMLLSNSLNSLDTKKIDF